MNAFKIERNKLEVKKEALSESLDELKEEKAELNNEKDLLLSVITDMEVELEEKSRNTTIVAVDKSNLKILKKNMINTIAISFLPSVVAVANLLFNDAVLAVITGVMGYPVTAILLFKTHQNYSASKNIAIRNIKNILNGDTLEEYTEKVSEFCEQIELSKEELEPTLNVIDSEINDKNIEINNLENQINKVNLYLKKLQVEQVAMEQKFIRENFDKYLNSQDTTLKGNYNLENEEETSFTKVR